MTFRIDSVERGDWGWRLNLKGMEGKGVYGRLVTTLDGHGLYVVDEEDMTRSKPGRQLLPAAEFAIPLECGPDEAKQRVAGALTKLGWGPEVNNAGRIIG